MSEIIVKALEGMGVPGAIIASLLLAIMILSGVIRVQYTNDRKVYGYRIAERDTLNQALNDASTVLKEQVQSAREISTLTEEHADLINKQIQAFELLRITVASQYDNIKEHNHASAQAVASMADAIRALNAKIIENQHLYSMLAAELKNYFDKAGDDLQLAIINDIRHQLGNDLTIMKRKRTVHDTRPKG